MGFVETTSSLIGLVSVLLCLVQKVPQLVSLMRTRNASGLSLPSLALELWCYSSTVSYSLNFSHPLSSFCEYPPLVIQDLVLLWFVLYYRHLSGLKSIAIFVLYLGVQFSMVTGMFPVRVMVLIINVGIPISATSKVLQLTKILGEKDSGNISAISWFIGAITSAARLFTFTVDVWDPSLALNMLISAFLNTAVFAATIYYKKPMNKNV